MEVDYRRTRHRQARLSTARHGSARTSCCATETTVRAGSSVFTNLPKCQVGLEACGGAHY